MKKIILLSAITFSMLSVFAQSKAGESASTELSASAQSSYTGVIMKSGDIWYIEVREKGETINYVPSELPDMFKKEGMIVQFSGELIPPPADVRLIGRPIKLTAIKAAEK